MGDKGPIAARFDHDDGARAQLLQEARICAALTKPWVLPPLDQAPNQKLPETYQSVGSRGVTNLEGRMLMALYPPDMPWFQIALDGAIDHDPDVPDELKQQFREVFFLIELLVQSVLESANLQTDGNRRPASFRSRKRQAISQVLITGDCLEQLTDDYRLRVFRRDMYVTCRDSSGDVLYHIIKELIDPLGLDDVTLNLAGINRDDIKEKPLAERMTPLYTNVEWQPQSRVWVVTQEINGKSVRVSEEAVSQFFSTPFELVSPEHYGRGFVEQNRGDLRTLNELELRMLDFAALASKVVPCIDENSNVRNEDLAKPSGEPIRCRVSNGVVQDVAFLQTNKITDFGIVYQQAERKRKDLGAAMLMESETQPRGERVTAYQVQRVAQELDGALGGVYAPIADDQQVPLLRRVLWQLRRDRLMPALPEKSVSIKVLTGIAALGRATKASQILSVTDAMMKLGERAMARVNMDVLINTISRYSGIDEPGLIKTPEQVEAETRAALAAQAQAQIAGKAIDVVGNVAEKTMTEGTTANA